MRYVEGQSLTQLVHAAKEGGGSTVFSVVGKQRIADTELSPSASDATTTTGGRKTHELDRVLKMIEKVARALHSAHEAGVVHRDIKPGNILVGQDDEPVILDFGLAQAEDAVGPTVTRSGDLLGTPAYMSPEQIAASRIEVDRRSDVYSLGVTFYECLTLARAFEAPTREALYQAILTREAPNPRRLNPTISADLRSILDTAMEKDRNRRYQTALDFAEDLRRFRQFEPIRARPIGPVLRARRWTQRHPVIATAFLGLALALGVAVGFWARAAGALRHTQAIALASKSAEVAATDQMLAMYLALEGYRKEPGLETISQLHSAFHEATEVRQFGGHGRSVMSAAFSADGLRVVTGCDDGKARVFDLDGNLLRTLPHPNRVRAAEFSGDGMILTGCANGVAYLWGKDDDENPVRTFTGHGGGIKSVAFSPGAEQYVLTGSGDGTARLWDRATGKELKAYGHKGPVKAVFSPDGEQVLTGSLEGSARLWERDSGKELQTFTAGDDHSGVSCRDVNFTPDGRTILTAWGDGIARLYSLEGVPGVTINSNAGEAMNSVTAFGDGASQWILTASGDLTAMISDTDGKELVRFTGHRAWLHTARFSPDGAQVLTTSVDGTARLWRIRDIEAPTLLGHPGAVTTAALSSDGRILTIARNNSVHLWSPEGEELQRWELAGLHPWACFSPDGNRILCDGGAGLIYKWDISEGDPTPVVCHDGRVTWGAFSPDGNRFVTASQDNTVKVWDWDGDGSPVAEFPHEEALIHAEFGPDNDTVVTASANGTARLWSVEDGFLRVVAQHDSGTLYSATFSSDGERIVTAGGDGFAIVWDLKAQVPQPLFRMPHRSFVHYAEFSPNDRLIATACRDGIARLWDGQTGALIATLKGHQGPVKMAMFSHTGDRVVTASLDRTARVWVVDPDDLVRLAEERLAWRLPFTDEELQPFRTLLGR
jgi:WD40 repeat protein